MSSQEGSCAGSLVRVNRALSAPYRSRCGEDFVLRGLPDIPERRLRGEIEGSVGSASAVRSLSTLAAVASTMRDRQQLESVNDHHSAASSHQEQLPSFSDFVKLSAPAGGALNNEDKGRLPTQVSPQMTNAEAVPAVPAFCPRPFSRLESAHSCMYPATASYLAKTLGVARPTHYVGKAPKHAADKVILDFFFETHKRHLYDQIVRPEKWTLHQSIRQSTPYQASFYLQTITQGIACAHDLKIKTVKDAVYSLNGNGPVKVQLGDKVFAVACASCVRRMLTGTALTVSLDDETLFYRVKYVLVGGHGKDNRIDKRAKAKKREEETNKRACKDGVFAHENKQKRVEFYAPKQTENVCSRPKVQVALDAVSASVEDEEEETLVEESPTARVDSSGYGPSGESSSWLIPDAVVIPDFPAVSAVEQPIVYLPIPKPRPSFDCCHRSGVCESEPSCFPMKTKCLKAEKSSIDCPFTASGMTERLKAMFNERRQVHPKKFRQPPHLFKDIHSYCKEPRVFDRSIPLDAVHATNILGDLGFRFNKSAYKFTQSEESNFWGSVLGHHLSEKYPLPPKTELKNCVHCPIDNKTTISLGRIVDIATARLVFNRDTMGACQYEWLPVPKGVRPDHFYTLSVPLKDAKHIPVGSVCVLISPTMRQIATKVSHPTIGFVSSVVAGSALVLKHALFAQYLDAVTGTSFIARLRGTKAPPTPPPVQPMPGFGTLGGLIVRAPLAPPLPTSPLFSIKTNSNVFKKGTTYKFNTRMKYPSLRALLNQKLSFRQKLLASGILKCEPSTLGLTPGPVGEDPASCFEVTCETAPLIDVTWDGTANVDLRCDQSRNAELLHEESLVQIWSYRRYYCGRIVAEARFFTDSNVLTTIMSSKAGLHPTLSPATRQILLSDEIYRIISNANVPARFNQLVLDAVEAATMVCHAKALDKAENRRALGYGGTVPLFH